MHVAQCLASIVCLLSLKRYCSGSFIDQLCGTETPKVEEPLQLKVDIINTEPAFVATFQKYCGTVKRIRKCTVFEGDDRTSEVGHAVVGASDAFTEATVTSKSGGDYTLTCYRHYEPAIKTGKYVPPKSKQTKPASKA